MQVLIPGTGRRYLDGDSLDHGAPLAFSVDGVFQPDECRAMIARIDAAQPTLAPITLSRGFAEMPDVRNNERVMFDDAPLAAELFARLRDALPARLAGRRLVGLNERLRCYRYSPGQRFVPHTDGAYRRNAHERSEITLLLYLNHDFVGGTTALYDFVDTPLHYMPRAGSVLLFQHHQMHEGCVVREGVKYVVRSDVMYAD
ncbi:MAG TPA: 2OG-Fe(II) oxygenase [Kofleriaceae bacterium]|nr:2OG-Fe(II) oxygenase [Kofleriaceae bacterium]